MAALVLGLVVSAVALLSADTSRPRAHSSQLCPQRFGSFATGHWPPACWRPYGPRSPFNLAIGPQPRLASDSGAIISYIASQHWRFDTDEHGNFTWSAQGTRPVYWSRGKDPVVKVVCTGENSCQRGMRLRIPKTARAETQSDAHMTVVEQATGREYDFYQARAPQGGVMKVSGGNSIAIGASSGTGLGGVAEAAYFGLLGGLVRASELKAGTIEHALAITVPCEQTRDVWPSPANGRGDTVCAGGVGPHFGNLLQLDMSESEIAATHAPAWQRAIMRAMARYGMYVVDSGGASERELSVLSEDDQSFTSLGYPPQMTRFVQHVGGGARLVGVPIDMARLRVIAPCVPQRTC